MRAVKTVTIDSERRVIITYLDGSTETLLPELICGDADAINALTEQVGELNEDITNLSESVGDLKSAFDNTAATSGQYVSKNIFVASGSAHSADNDRLNVNMKSGSLYFIKVDTDDSTDAISVTIKGNNGGSDITLSAPTTNAGFAVRPYTLSSDITSIGMYVAAQSKNVSYIITVRCVESYPQSILNNTQDVEMCRNTVKNLNDGKTSLFIFSDFINGALDAGIVKGYGYGRISSVDIITFDNEVTVTIASGFKADFHFFVNGNYDHKSNWKTGSYVVPAGSSFRCMIARVTEISGEIADIPTFVKQVTCQTDRLINEIEIQKTNDIRLAILEGKYAINPDNFEFGDISINSNGWTYSNNSRRVRTKQSYDLELDVGDIIRLKDYTKANMYIGYQVNTNTTDGYGAAGWLNQDYECKYGGKYCILIKSVPTETSLSDKSQLLSLLEIIKYNTTEKQADIAKAVNNSVIKSVNHRGLNRTAPENTIPAFKLSKVYGFDYVETDVCFTSDGVAVLLHDSTINRTARNSDGTTISGDIGISSITYETALTYDFGLYKAARWEGTKIPTFEQLVKLAKQLDIGIYAELKTYGATEALVKGLVNIAKAYGMQKKITWISYEQSLLNYIIEVDPYARVGMLANSVTQTVIDTASALVGDHNEVFINSGSSTDTEVNLCKTAGIQMERFCPNTKTSILALPDYVTGVSSDFLVASVVNYENAMAT